MADLLTFDEDTLADAAELRAEGATWDATAKDLGTDVATLRAAIRRQRPLWQTLIARARAEVAAQAADEAVHCLRKQLRSEDEKTVLNASGWLLRLRMTTIRHARKASPKKEKAAKPKGPSGRELPEVSEEGMWTQHYIESLSPEEYAQFAEDCHDSYRRAKEYEESKVNRAPEEPMSDDAGTTAEPSDPASRGRQPPDSSAPPAKDAQQRTDVTTQTPGSVGTEDPAEVSWSGHSVTGLRKSGHGVTGPRKSPLSNPTDPNQRLTHSLGRANMDSPPDTRLGYPTRQPT